MNWELGLFNFCRIAVKLGQNSTINANSVLVAKNIVVQIYRLEMLTKTNSKIYLFKFSENRSKVIDRKSIPCFN